MTPVSPRSEYIFACTGVEKLCAWGVSMPDEQTPLGIPSDEKCLSRPIGIFSSSSDYTSLY
jgi:hypothetical protein